MKKKVYYLNFYCDKNFKEQLEFFPSSLPKVEYIIKKLKELDFNVINISQCVSSNSKFKKRNIIVDSNETHVYFSSVKFKNRLFTKINRLWVNIKAFLFILFTVKKDEPILVYHSLNNLNLIYWLEKVFHKNLILEVEEIYSYVSSDLTKLKAKEVKAINTCHKFIVVNDLIRNKINKNCNVIISYGPYITNPFVKCNNLNESTNKIKMVYAGVIENNRKAAFKAVESMRYLPDCYELHIVGFGDSQNIVSLEKLISDINKETGKESISYDGHMDGDTYYSFLSKCDIGLSTHCYSKKELDSADNSFPSKLLIYLSSGLNIVAQNLDVLKKSKLSQFISYYDGNSPENIAMAILKCNSFNKLSKVNFIKELDEIFLKDLKNILGR